eukprot:Skav221045  [mRNA]  locus=scaffold1448:254439:257677:+ [translate_table: standard]
MHVLYLFSGHARKTSVAACLRQLAEGVDFNIVVDEVDICHTPDHDMTDKKQQAAILEKIRLRYYAAILVTPPCSTWSRVRGANTRGPPMIRSKGYPWGFPWLAAKFHLDLQLGNELVRFTIEVIKLVVACSRQHRVCWCAFFAEHPEDLGVIWREEDGKELHPASIWQLDDLRAAVDDSGELQLKTIAINQCCWGAPYRKPTRLISNMHLLLLDQAIAKAILAWYHPLRASSFAEVGMEKEEPEKAVEVPMKEVVDVPKTVPKRPRDPETGPTLHAVVDERKRRKVASGPPMKAYYKGETRTINDGGGLCSPGRWPPRSRNGLRGSKGVKLAAEVKKLYLQWLAKENAAGDEPLGTFWKMAAGKMTQSPFEKDIDEMRRSLDEFLRREGEKPDRLKGDRSSIVNFRRLRAALRIADDPDCDFLEIMASKGVPIGVDVEMPRTEAIFEEKTKWTVEGTDEDFQDIVAENYRSAEENAEDIRRQVKEDVEAGTIVRYTAAEAEEKFKGRLAVAALGAVPKELNSSKVRLIHDGSYSVDVNRRIRVKDKMRFPLVDDAASVLASVEDSIAVEEDKIRFSMVYDIAKAHRLIPVREEDWGLQAFRLPGLDGTGEKEEDIYCHTCGTFGVASAAYWWGRCAASLIRVAHGLAGVPLGLWHLLFADDGWMVATGKWFWRKILFWFFVMDLFEFPISWKKVSGGVVCQWIGYELDVKSFRIGISEKKRRWLQDWVDGKKKDGGALGRDVKSALGRLSFVAGALRHVRPFLGPLYAWSTILAPGTFAAFPVAVAILLDFVVDEVKRCPMRRAARVELASTDCFRVDAKAAGEEVVIGGWESYGGKPTHEARWFSIRLSRRVIPWAYAKGEPFRSIASLELLAVMVAVMLFSKEAAWKDGRRMIALPAYTDNLANMHVMRKFGSSRFPLSIVAMELACQLDRAQVELDLTWIPRGQNQEADDLTNEKFDDFDSGKRIVVSFEQLEWVLLDRLMERASELDEELKLHKTSKEAKRAAHLGATEASSSKRRKGEMKWKDPW